MDCRYEVILSPGQNMLGCFCIGEMPVNRNRIIIIFTVSLVVSLVTLSVGDAALKKHNQQRMISYAIASSRESDGAQNLLIMNGKNGYVGTTNVYLKYLTDGYIHLSGDNPEGERGWKKISEFNLEPGQYTLTGIKNVPENTIALQLHFIDNTGFYQYLYQWNEDIEFTIERLAEADIHMFVNPYMEAIDTVARPAVYKDE